MCYRASSQHQQQHLYLKLLQPQPKQLRAREDQTPWRCTQHLEHRLDQLAVLERVNARL
eukprot:NODE_12199_length_1239_cov_5.648381.p7 GENE.NODE_12199_length_1239_cov_5.648381~~NODE_12199_length_1239_cov_5.648381.p7  ORF type:complete len:59 (-),score=9.87 NODE_12199_length_1239_cov_5.648381:1001-1177(-)